MYRRKKKDNLFYVALYMRLSREDGDKDESDSIASQRSILRDYLDHLPDCIIVDEYIDDGFTGTNFKRPSFQSMIRAIEAGDVNCVIVKDLSRFGREYIEAGHYLEKYFPDNDVRFIAVNDHIDSFKRDYDMLMPVKNIFNAQYARDISDKVQSSFKAKQKEGKFIGAFAGYGYQKSYADKHKLVVDEYAAGVVQRVFSMFIDGKGLRTIAKTLNEEKVLCPSAYKRSMGLNYTNSNKLEQTQYWTYSTINKMLRNEMYLGNMVQGKTKRRMKGKAKPVEKENWIRKEDTHQAIIDLETWEKAQTLLELNTRQLNLECNNSFFQGFLKCPDCGRSLTKKLPTKKAGEERVAGDMSGVSYHCGSYTRYGKAVCTKHYIPHEVLVQAVLSDLNQLLQSINDLKEIVKTQEVQLPKQEDLIRMEHDKLRIEYQRIKKLKKECYEDYKQDLISREDYIMYRKDYDEKEQLLQKKIDSIEEKQRKTTSNDIFDHPWIKKLLKHNEFTTLDREILVDFIDKIYVYEDKRIKIVYKITDDVKDILSDTLIVKHVVGE